MAAPLDHQIRPDPWCIGRAWSSDILEAKPPLQLPYSLLETITNSFSSETRIGAGGYGIVYRGVVPQDGGSIAVKKLVNLDPLEWELALHKITSPHPNIVIERMHKARGSPDDFKSEIRGCRHIQELTTRVEAMEATISQIPEELRKVLLSHFNNIPGARTEKNLPPTYKLVFVNSMSDEIFTKRDVRAVEGGQIKFKMVVSNQKDNNCSRLLPSNVKIVVLDGDFNAGNEELWTPDEFDDHIVRPRGKVGAVLTGKLDVKLKDGEACLQDITFIDNSSFTRSQKFRLGVKLLDDLGERVLEGVTEPFTVKDRRGEGYKKHEIPWLVDKLWLVYKLWCQEKIGEGGFFHNNVISSVLHLIWLYYKDGKALRYILGNASPAAWKAIINHVKKCDPGRSLYSHFIEDKNIRVYVSSLGQIVGATIAGQYNAFGAVASGRLKWRTYYQIIKGLCQGLDYRHHQNIVHLDLKPANILLEDCNMVPKISDFGLSRCFDEKQARAITAKVVGTLGYMAPEFISSGVITIKSDIYSLGIIIIEILTGQKGYLQTESVLENWSTRFQISHGGLWLEHARVCAKIGLECMDSDPVKRPITRQIIERLDELECTYGFIETKHWAIPVIPAQLEELSMDAYKSITYHHHDYEMYNGQPRQINCSTLQESIIPVHNPTEPDDQTIHETDEQGTSEVNGFCGTLSQQCIFGRIGSVRVRTLSSVLESNETDASFDIDVQMGSGAGFQYEAPEANYTAGSVTLHCPGSPCDVKFSVTASAKGGVDIKIGSLIVHVPKHLSLHHPLVQMVLFARDKFDDIFSCLKSMVLKSIFDMDKRSHHRSERGIKGVKAKILASWVVATAAPHHATGNRDLLSGFITEHDDQFVHALDGVPMPVRARGAVITDAVVLPDVWFVPGLTANLVSVSQLAELGYSVGFGYGECCIRSVADGKIVGDAHLQESGGGLYVLDFLKIPLAI